MTSAITGSKIKNALASVWEKPRTNLSQAFILFIKLRFLSCPRIAVLEVSEISPARQPSRIVPWAVAA